jgi:hypothetical protein
MTREYGPDLKLGQAVVRDALLSDLLERRVAPIGSILGIHPAVVQRQAADNSVEEDTVDLHLGQVFCI